MTAWKADPHQPGSPPCSARDMLCSPFRTPRLTLVGAALRATLSAHSSCTEGPLDWRSLFLRGVHALKEEQHQPELGLGSINGFCRGGSGTTWEMVGVLLRGWHTLCTQGAFQLFVHSSVSLSSPQKHAALLEYRPILSRAPALQPWTSTADKKLILIPVIFIILRIWSTVRFILTLCNSPAVQNSVLVVLHVSTVKTIH